MSATTTGRTSILRPRRDPVTLTAGGKAAEWLTLAAMLTLLPRLFGPADYGSFGLALGLVSLGSTATALGGPSAMARFVAAAPPDQRAGLARALAFRAIRWRAAGLILLTAIVLVAVRVMPERLPPFPTLIVLTAVVLDAAATLVFQIALGLDQQVLWSFRYPLQNLLLVIAAPVLYSLAGPLGALSAIALSSAAALALGVRMIHGHLVGPLADVPAEASRFAVLQAMNGLLVQLLHRGGIVAVALLAGSRVEMGYAALALGVAIACTYAVWQVFLIALPSLAEVASVSLPDAQARLTRLTNGVALLVLPAAIVGVALVGPLLGLLAGGRFSSARVALATALAIVPLAPLTGAVSAAAAIRLQPGARLWSTAAGAVVAVVTLVALVPRLGATGASAALLAGTFASALAGAAVFRDALDSRLIAGSFVGCALAVVIGVGR